MGMPVVTVVAGGLPVVDVTATTGRGSPVTEAANGRGVAVTKVASGGMPVAYETIGGGGGGGGPGPEATAFLARTSGLDATHTNAYTALINGLVADGVWARLDMLHVYATQDSTTALLNLVSTSYNGTATNTPTFTADRGYQAPSTGGNKFINTSFNPATASSPKFTQNSAHLAMWNTLSGVSTDGAAMGMNNGSNNYSSIYPRHSGSGNTLYPVNSSVNTFASGITSDPIGHFIANRSTSTNQQLYLNGASVATNTNTSTAPASLVYVTLCSNDNGGSFYDGTYRLGMASIGASLSSIDATNFYNRLRTYMTAVGVP